MGKQQKRKRQPFKGFGDEPTPVIFIGKPHYSAEWPGTSLVIDEMGVFTVTAQSGDIGVLGYSLTVWTPDGPLQGVYGMQLHKEPGHPEQMVVNACPPTRAADLKPYTGFITGMVGDMSRNGSLPSFEELCRDASESGAIVTPAD